MKNNILKYIGILVLLIAANSEIWAQEALSEVVTPKSEATAMTWMLNNLILVIGITVFIGGFFAIFNVLDKLVQFERLKLLAAKGIITPDTVQQVEKESFLKRWYDKAWNIAPIEKEKDIILAHPHDGIYELDNKLPPWWLALFYGGVIFAVFHVFYNHFSGYGISTAEEYKIEMAKAEVDIRDYLAGQANLVDETNVTVLASTEDFEEGKVIFAERCVACHGGLGEGGIGPNFTDEYWIHGGDIKSIFKTVKYGVPEKGMQAWRTSLTAGQMNQVASYILTLQGTNPPNAKEAEGTLYQPEIEEENSEVEN